jgi:hypothetical protein
MSATKRRTRKPDQDDDRLKRLAAFAPTFRSPELVSGKWHPMTGQGTFEDPHTFPWFEMGDVATRLCAPAEIT